MQSSLRLAWVLTISSALLCGAVHETHFATSSRNGDPPAAPKTSGIRAWNKSEAILESLLTVDGGGLRCVVAVEILIRVERAIAQVLKDVYDWTNEDLLRNPVVLADFFTAFSGVNCGAWVSSYLATKCGKMRCKHILGSRRVTDAYRHHDIPAGSALGLKVMFQLYGKDIFPTPESTSFVGSIRHVVSRRCVPLLWCPMFPVQGYRSVLSQFLGDAPMEDLPATLILPMYDLIRRAVVTVASDSLQTDKKKQQFTFIFESPSEPLDPRSADDSTAIGFLKFNNRTYSLLDVTQAAGSRVATHEANRFQALNEPSFELLCIDTSLLFNNPSVVAITAMGLMRSTKSIKDISMLSIGTGWVDGSLEYQKDTGMFQWLVFQQDLFAVIIHGGSELIQTQVDAFMYSVLGTQHDPRGSEYCYGQYLRIQSSASVDTPMGKALVESTNMTFFERLVLIGSQTGFFYEESIHEFVKTFVMNTDEKIREDRYLANHLIPMNMSRRTGYV